MRFERKTDPSFPLLIMASKWRVLMVISALAPMLALSAYFTFPAEPHRQRVLAASGALQIFFMFLIIGMSCELSRYRAVIIWNKMSRVRMTLCFLGMIGTFSIWLMGATSEMTSVGPFHVIGLWPFLWTMLADPTFFNSSESKFGSRHFKSADEIPVKALETLEAIGRNYGFKIVDETAGESTTPRESA